MISINAHNILSVSVSEPIQVGKSRWQTYTFWDKDGIALEVCAFLQPEVLSNPVIKYNPDRTE